MKKPESFLKEYARNLPDDHLYFLHMRFSQNLCGDRAEIAELMQGNHTIDKWLSSANTAEDWFDMFDLIGSQIRQEVERKAAEKEQRREYKRRSDKEYIKV
jgi:hypothetical protein